MKTTNFTHLKRNMKNITVLILAYIIVAFRYTILFLVYILAHITKFVRQFIKILRHFKWSFLLHPIFILSLVLTCYIVYVIFTSDPLLCDEGGSSLYELKIKLTKEIAKFRVASIHHECYSDLNQQLADISRPNFRNFSQEDYYYNKIVNAKVEMAYCAEKIGDLEAAIKKVDAGFKSTVDYSTYSNIKFSRVSGK